MKKNVWSVLAVLCFLLLWTATALAQEPPPADFFWDLDAVDPDNAITVSYHSGGGSGSMEPNVADLGSVFALPRCAFSPPQGQRFQAWVVNGEEYDAGDMLTLNADTTVTALWKESGSLIIRIQNDQIPKQAVLKERYDGWFIVRPASESGEVHFQILSGALPDGLSLSPDGYITGTPEEVGTFVFTVEISRKDGGRIDVPECTITVENPKEEEIPAQNPGGDDVQGPIDADSKIGTNIDQNNPDQNRKPSEKENDGLPNLNDPDVFSPDDGPQLPDAEIPRTDTPDKLFSDVPQDAWYLRDLDWACQNNVIGGYEDGTFRQSVQINGAMSVVVLARLDKVDLNQYKNKFASGIPDGQWYTDAARWARLSGILPAVTFAGRAPLARGQMALLLLNYLNHEKVRTNVPPTPISFADAGQMTPEENDAFQVLYRLGIFNGRGNRIMDPRGYTTRAHLVALLHRMDTFIAAH